MPAGLSLPLVTLPHLITSSLAMSLQSDVLPRLTHSQAAIRKKTVATLYRSALVYPETLRPAWPRIKERLMDESEDPSVTAAIVNVVCELGWRRPQDFLPLAPRLFGLLVDSGNNWMAIKIIKLVSVTGATRAMSRPLAYGSLTCAVCYTYPTRAPPRAEAPTSADIVDPYHPSHVSLIRVYQWHHPRRHSGEHGGYNRRGRDC